MRRTLAVVVTVVATLSLLGAGGPPAGSSTLQAGGPPPVRSIDVKALKPPIVKDLIPYTRKRRQEMAAYSKRHYGRWAWRLTNPKVIVEHYTDGTSYKSAWYTFAANSVHNGELPGVCSQFIIDTDGTIYQLVPLYVRCRHAVGMNYTSIGIEHVGTSDRAVLDDTAEMRASLRLTLWLMAKYGINIGNVNGHNETIYSSYRKELNPSWQCLVHADFPHWAMNEYRTRLADLASRKSVPVGAGPHWVNNYNC